jgi:hypothetical protein
MVLKLERNIFHAVIVIGCFCLSAFANSHVLLKPDVSRAHREELIARLRVITGLSNLNFETDGTLRFDVNQKSGGSASARELLSQAVQRKRDRARRREFSIRRRFLSCCSWSLDQRWIKQAAGLRGLDRLH